MSRGRPRADVDPNLHPDRRALAEAMRKHRSKSGMTARQVAAKVPCSPAAVSHAESGRRVPRPKLFEGMIKAMGGNAKTPRMQTLYGAAVTAITLLGSSIDALVQIVRR
ncbi:helix-turn-helix domain-containing protein [Streptomyces sp. NPDC059761]|uniref:helix-turn-helix domain-containing protein n=1 Tax=Streptomyces sp. NPDC059761 TaxID=3346937 RepID=UPI003661DB2C